MTACLPLDSIFLGQERHQTLQSRLMSGMVTAIMSAGCVPGTRIPSTRYLANALGLSRMTVTLVYAELAAMGYIESKPRSGFVVASTVPVRRLSTQGDGAPEAGGSVNWDEWLPPHTPRKRVIRKPADWRDYPYPFIFGQTDPSLLDHAAWRDCARRALGRNDFGEMSVDLMTRDDPRLVEQICTATLPRRGISARPDEVLITVGSQNALYLTLELLARDDRPTVIEEPGYPDFAETLRARGVPMQFATVDEGGLDLGAIPAGTKMVVVTPSHHIPTGATMPMDRRRALLERAEADDFLIIEDDYDYEMSYLAPPMPALKSLDRNGRVIYLGSFSKSLFPGLRMGYLVGPAPLIEAARAERAMMLRHPASQMQRITAYFLSLGYYEAHIHRLREAMAARMACLVQSLADTPFRIAGAGRDGGACLWVEAPAGVDSRALANAAVARGVLIEPGDVFFEHPPQPCPFFRLGCASIGTERIPLGIAALTEALAELA
ncbi:PLP-dependent aminotransferase family protein [Paracoccus suum]|uniref:PLP-dependent aminotransferase family protein n=1 Tax=Paracoccus suum TaxID=2259340 RepID=A0A344PIP0_9RHOB|nr:PLP-dependent aminotransferase family protein [Paracoccus suum]AXC49245.1 PLP-dependent aminotransferase family protein [Paracoccus suum]